MNILQKIIFHKQEELEVRRAMVPEAELMASMHFRKPCRSLCASLTKPGASGIIAEFKRKSPSLGWIHQHANVLQVTQHYAQAGASGLSVLTDHEFFGGSTEDLVAARQNDIPILRKDFIIDPYQVVAAKAMGADVILLIAACLTVQQTKLLAAFAKEMKLEVLLEIHEEAELAHICENIDMVGVNNRNLKTFTSNINLSLRLASKIPAGRIKIAESGISSTAAVRRLREAGFSGFLMGGHFMKQQHPGAALKHFIAELES